MEAGGANAEIAAGPTGSQMFEMTRFIQPHNIGQFVDFFYIVRENANAQILHHRPSSIGC